MKIETIVLLCLVLLQSCCNCDTPVDNADKKEYMNAAFKASNSCIDKKWTKLDNCDYFDLDRTNKRACFVFISPSMGSCGDNINIIQAKNKGFVSVFNSCCVDAYVLDEENGGIRSFVYMDRSHDKYKVYWDGNEFQTELIETGGINIHLLKIFSEKTGVDLHDFELVKPYFDDYQPLKKIVYFELIKIGKNKTVNLYKIKGAGGFSDYFFFEDTSLLGCFNEVRSFEIIETENTYFDLKFTFDNVNDLRDGYYRCSETGLIQLKQRDE